MVRVWDYGIVESAFEIHSRNNDHFPINIFRKGTKTLILQVVA